MSLSSHQSARMKNDEWLTPPSILTTLGSFDLDPCSPINRPWPTATTHYTKQDNGLTKPWFGRVWLNPPFGQEAKKWFKKMAEHNNGIALIPARTETHLFFEFIWDKASAILFLKGRPRFYTVDGKAAPFNSGAPICLVAYGQQNAVLLKQSSLGFCVCCK
ncbi:adenine methyltransferase [Endozoicomonas sp. SM1973]|uniref:Adenine methyltransferase n=1 Tax=Spartinivicinus marinus TaxID=2994442 RepID=A0A853IHE7_9GAMM|nr:DNA N-6-adenine-methyltransferase [Spartinivicinus marinus]MCX4030382.1 DNA N-6-adenine-methyltransferase [Spartinivicinus marinus]MCX4030450.1 DNA N-6-adenine-methyltransferase [Spartinivicinus marinus]NYZ69461.1 adenine methyltransferase [Spartinivicinus marinus]